MREASCQRRHAGLVATMSELFAVRFATTADAGTIAWHRARMFQDMGEVPPDLFETFRAQAQPRIEGMLNGGQYVGWLASFEGVTDGVIGGAGVQLYHTLPRPISQSGEVRIADGRQGIIINVFTEPEWRRRGVAGLLMKRIIDWSRKTISTVSSSMPPMKAVRFTNAWDSSLATRCDSLANNDLFPLTV